MSATGDGRVLAEEQIGRYAEKNQTAHTDQSEFGEKLKQIRRRRRGVAGDRVSGHRPTKRQQVYRKDSIPQTEDGRAHRRAQRPPDGALGSYSRSSDRFRIRQTGDCEEKEKERSRARRGTGFADDGNPSGSRSKRRAKRRRKSAAVNKRTDAGQAAWTNMPLTAEQGTPPATYPGPGVERTKSGTDSS